MSIVSTLNPAFSGLTDTEVYVALRELEAQRASLIESGSDDTLDAIDRQIFLLDDELCARDLPFKQVQP